MTDESKTKAVRNAMLGVAFVVMLGLVGYAERNNTANVPDEPDPSDVIDIVVAKEPLAMPEQFREVLKALDAWSIVVINSKNEVIAFSVDGEPRDLCAPSESSDHSARACKQEIPIQDFVMTLGTTSTSNPCGTCVVGGKARSCRKSNNKRNCTTQEFSCGRANCVSN